MFGATNCPLFGLYQGAHVKKKSICKIHHFMMQAFESGAASKVENQRQKRRIKALLMVGIRLDNIMYAIYKNSERRSISVVTIQGLKFRFRWIVVM